MHTPKSSFVFVIVLLSAIANFLLAILHMAMLFMGPWLYQFLGAPTLIVSMVEQQNWLPLILIMSTIALAFASCGCYALSALGLIRRLPALSVVMLLITVVYCLRGSVVLLWPFPGLVQRLFSMTPAWQDGLFSAAWLVVGLVYGIAWMQLCRDKG